MTFDIKIATILPYKENYTFSKAQSSNMGFRFFTNSKFKKIILFLGTLLKRLSYSQLY